MRKTLKRDYVMKKIFVGLAVLCLSACYLKGDYTLGRRNTFNDFFWTYNIRYYDDHAFESMSQEIENVSNYKLNVARHAVKGGVILSSEIVQKQVYSNEYVRPTMKGALVSYTVPIELSDEKVYKTIGESEINGKTYRLLEPNRIGDVVLVDFDGNIYPRVGRIYNDRLALLETSFLLEPENIKFVNETKTQAAGGSVVSGFKVRYAGLDGNYRMVFKFVMIAEDGSELLDEARVYTFPMYDKTVTFEGITLEILEADESGVDYKILNV